MSQVRNIDIVIRICVLRVGSRLTVAAHIVTAGLQRRGVEPENFRRLGTTKEVSLDLGRVIFVSLQIDFHSGQWWGGRGVSAGLLISRRQRCRSVSHLGSFRVGSHSR